MDKSQIIENIREVAASVLPKGSSLYLYGSRARGIITRIPIGIFYYCLTRNKMTEMTFANMLTP